MLSALLRQPCLSFTAEGTYVLKLDFLDEVATPNSPAGTRVSLVTLKPAAGALIADDEGKASSSAATAAGTATATAAGTTTAAAGTTGDAGGTAEARYAWRRVPCRPIHGRSCRATGLAG